ncbi:hypothetical protein IWW38_006033, partial [Coemansia aciculifera]
MCSTHHIYERSTGAARVGVLYSFPDPIFMCGDCQWTSDDVDEFVEHRKGHNPGRFAPPPEPPKAPPGPTIRR